MKHITITALRIAVASAFALCFTPALGGDLTPRQKDSICRVSLARINGNAPGDYKGKGKNADIFVYASARGYIYECEVFSDGMAFTISNNDWGRLRPTGSVTREGKCANIKLFDPGFGITHQLKSCVQ